MIPFPNIFLAHARSSRCSCGDQKKINGTHTSAVRYLSHVKGLGLWGFETGAGLRVDSVMESLSTVDQPHANAWRLSWLSEPAGHAPLRETKGEKRQSIFCVQTENARTFKAGGGGVRDSDSEREQRSRDMQPTQPSYPPQRLSYSPRRRRWRVGADKAGKLSVLVLFCIYPSLTTLRSVFWMIHNVWAIAKERKKSTANKPRTTGKATLPCPG